MCHSVYVDSSELVNSSTTNHEWINCQVQPHRNCYVMVKWTAYIFKPTFSFSAFPSQVEEQYHKWLLTDGTHGSRSELPRSFAAYIRQSKNIIHGENNRGDINNTNTAIQMNLCLAYFMQSTCSDTWMIFLIINGWSACLHMFSKN